MTSLYLPFWHSDGAGVSLTEGGVHLVVVRRSGESALVRHHVFEPCGPSDDARREALVVAAERAGLSSPLPGVPDLPVAVDLPPAFTRLYTADVPDFDDPTDQAAWMERYIDGRIPDAMSPDAFRVYPVALASPSSTDGVGARGVSAAGTQSRPYLLYVVRKEAVERRAALCEAAGLHVEYIGPLEDQIGVALGLDDAFSSAPAASVLAKAGPFVSHARYQRGRLTSLERLDTLDALPASVPKASSGPVYVFGETSTSDGPDPVWHNAVQRMAPNVRRSLPPALRAASRGPTSDEVAEGAPELETYDGEASAQKEPAHPAPTGRLSATGLATRAAYGAVNGASLADAARTDAAARRREQGDGVRTLAAAVTVVAVLTLLLGGAHVWIQSRLAVQRAELQETRPLLEERDRLEQTLADLTARRQATASVQARPFPVAAILGEMTRAAPRRLWVHRLRLSTRSASPAARDTSSWAAIQFDGWALTASSIQQFVDDLDRHPGFSHVRLRSAQHMPPRSIGESGRPADATRYFQMECLIPPGQPAPSPPPNSRPPSFSSRSSSDA